MLTGGARPNERKSGTHSGTRPALIEPLWRRLLHAARVRVEPVLSLLKPLAEQVKAKLRDTLIGMAITKFLTLLGALIGYIWALL